MVHTVRVYAYGTTVRVWYGYLYHMRIALLYYYCLQATYIIAITNTVLLFVLDHVHSTAICSDALCGPRCGLMHSDKLIISGLANNNPHLHGLLRKLLELLLYAANYNIVVHVFICNILPKCHTKVLFAWKIMHACMHEYSGQSAINGITRIV